MIYSYIQEALGKVDEELGADWDFWATPALKTLKDPYSRYLSVWKARPDLVSDGRQQPADDDQSMAIPVKSMILVYLPVEKVRDEELRLRIMYSAHQYAISEEQLSEIEDATTEQRCAYLLGMAKSAQQKLQYNLYGSNQSIQREGLHWSLAASRQVGQGTFGTGGRARSKIFMEM